MWQELYRLVLRYLLNLGLAREDAEDLAQDTLVAAYLHMDGVEDGKLRAWLFTVARRKFVDWLRRNKKGVALVEINDEETLDRSGDPEELVLDAEHRELILAALGPLSPTERNLLIMKYNLGLSYGEIAKALKMKPNTVKVSLYRARQKFRDEYLKLKRGFKHEPPAT